MQPKPAGVHRLISIDEMNRWQKKHRWTIVTGLVGLVSSLAVWAIFGFHWYTALLLGASIPTVIIAVHSCTADFVFEQLQRHAPAEAGWIDSKRIPDDAYCSRK